MKVVNRKVELVASEPLAVGSARTEREETDGRVARGFADEDVVVDPPLVCLPESVIQIRAADIEVHSVQRLWKGVAVYFLNTAERGERVRHSGGLRRGEMVPSGTEFYEVL